MKVWQHALLPNMSLTLPSIAAQVALGIRISKQLSEDSGVIIAVLALQHALDLRVDECKLAACMHPALKLSWARLHSILPAHMLPFTSSEGPRDQTRA